MKNVHFIALLILTFSESITTYGQTPEIGKSAGSLPAEQAIPDTY